MSPEILNENLEKELDILEENHISFDDFPSFKIEKKDFHKYALLSPLLEIRDAPKELYFKFKDEEILNNFLQKTFDGEEYKILTVVGSRRNTNYGKEVLDYLLKYLVGEKIVVVSGLALGIDSWAHKTALKNNFPTISIPGSGLSSAVLYPANNLELAENILENNNLMISEYEEDKKSQMYFFPARNRIMAAISDAVLIVEAGEKSGTLITARLAMEYGKNVGVIPNNIFAEASLGSNKLIQDGATPVLSELDILEMLRISENSQRVLDLNFYTKENEEQLKKLLNKLNKNERNLLQKIIEAGSVEKDILLSEVEEEFGTSYTDSLVALMSLEINGFIKEEMGEIRIIK
ncbi:hypothetical protein SDC9_07838 [bioreactor metagenome]|uniref:Smf/DprA SLOG domain-containing protein n=1 Tax=bioreactor metagenome TaxID=1076179 RepID=A0A644T624_9ZZZZ|nr:DNA-processing protein DprA [Candidatus Elulimicrobiales bacterium]